MDPAMQRVGTWLQSTLLPDKATREAAEQALRLSELEPGHVVLLLKLAVDTSLPIEPVLRQCAVTYMKNVIKQRWDPPEPPPHRKNEGRTEPLTEADKAVVRSNLVEAIAVSVPAVRAQLALCLRSIAMTDYPDRWPELLNVICASLSAADEPHLHGGLLSLRVGARAGLDPWPRSRLDAASTLPRSFREAAPEPSAPPTGPGKDLRVPSRWPQ